MSAAMVLPFDGHQVRVLGETRDGKYHRLIPLADVAEATGLDREGLRKIIKRNERVFAGWVLSVVTSDNVGRPRLTTSLTRDGVIALLMKVATERVQDPAKQEAIIRFQRWSAEALGDVMESEVAEAQEIRRLELDIERLRLEKEAELRGQVLALIDKYPEKFSRSELVPLIAGAMGHSVPAERTYSASEVAEMLSREMGRKISANLIGRVVNRLGIRPEEGENEYAITTVTKALHADKVVPQTKYKRPALELIRGEIARGRPATAKLTSVET